MFTAESIDIVENVINCNVKCVDLFINDKHELFK